MATKLLAAFLMVMISSCRPKETCSFAKENCNPDPNICSLECSNESGDGSTPCEVKQSGAGCTDPVPMPTFDEMKADKCKSTCNDPAVADCKYYRYENQESKHKKICYIMGATQCAVFGEGCVANEESKPDCESGKSDSNDCEDSNHGVPTAEHSCPSQSPETTPGIMPDYKLHWTCYTPSGDEHDIHGTDDAPGDTVCTAKPDCIKGDPQKDQNYKYTCVHDDTLSPADPTKGKWEWKGSANPDGLTDPGLVETDGKLKEPTCNADDLTVTDYQNQIKLGMEILCVENNDDGNTAPDSDGKIEAQNSCLLFCDGYPILNFYTNKAEWKYTMMDDSVENNLNQVADIIFCHK